jgi:hypothetical protein
MDHVGEFMSPNFHELMPFKYLLLLMIVILAISKIKTNLIELLLILMFLNMSLFSVRYIPLFSIIAAPILLRLIRPMLLERSDGKLVKFLNKRADGISEIDASAKGYLWPITALVVVVVLVASGKIAYTFDPETKPVAAVEFLEKENLKGNMFANDEFGDYIIYAAWPEYKVFVDGRSDMYGTEIMKEYLKVISIKPGWEEILNKYHINWIIYNSNTILSLFLMERDDWKLIYADKVANIFVKDIPENQYLIEKYPDVKLVEPEDEENT